MIFTFINKEWPKHNLGAIVKKGAVFSAADPIKWAESHHPLAVKTLIRWALRNAESITIQYTKEEMEGNVKQGEDYFEKRIKEIKDSKEKEQAHPSYDGWSAGS